MRKWLKIKVFRVIANAVLAGGLGLSHINRESIDAIRTAVWELEKAGYITRRQGRDDKGKMTAIAYTIYEQPQTPPEMENPILENQRN